jgi:hypothetical protein
MDHVGEIGNAKPATESLQRYGQARKRLASAPSAEQETILKAARNYGGPLYAPASLQAKAYQHFGPVVVSCDQGDIRLTPLGVWVYGPEKEYFEENIAKPMKEAIGMVGRDIQVAEEDTYEGFKHYLVNKQTNEVRKFKTIEEILSCDRMAEEEYMGVSSFKKYMNERLFGARKRKEESLNEVVPTGEESDEEMNLKAKKLMDLIGKRIPQNIIKTITTPVAQREVIAAFAELIGVPRTGLNNLIGGLKDISKQPEQPVTENKVISKKSLEESLIEKKVIKTVKVKETVATEKKVAAKKPAAKKEAAVKVAAEKKPAAKKATKKTEE